MINDKFIIGLTGGYSSGKTTVADMLVHYGFLVIDADKIARDVVDPGSDTLKKITSRWGYSVLLPNGALNREKLASIVFKNEKERIELEKIIHPVITDEIFRWIGESDKDRILVVAPLLLESGMSKYCDLIIALVAPEEVRIQRAMAKYQTNREMVTDRMRAQMSDEERASKSDIVIDTNCTLDELKIKIDETVKRIKESIEKKRGKE